MRNLKFSQGLAEATLLAMEANPKVFLIGEGIDDPKGAFGTTSPAFKKYGSARVWDSPLSENALTGIGIGAAIQGYPCVMIHMRTEFLLYAMDQIINHAAKWRYMNGGVLSVPITIRCLIGRGWGQAAQHSQSFHSMLMQVPGLKVILPSTAREAKGLLYSAILDPDPVICIEHRWLYDKEEPVEEEAFRLPLTQARIVAPGKDVTCVALSYQVLEAMKARETLLGMGIEMEVIDLRSVRPLDTATVIRSVQKTGRLLCTDVTPVFGGVMAEVSAQVTEKAFGTLKAAPVRVGSLDAPTPCSYALEDKYYPSVETLVQAALGMCREQSEAAAPTRVKPYDSPNFVGPF